MWRSKLYLGRLRNVSNDRMKFKRMFEAEARKFDHVSTL